MWNYTYNTTTWPVPTGVTNVEYLLVAGGGAGGVSIVGDSSGGGGGAGGLITGTGFPVSGTIENITIGAGGVTGRPNGSSSNFSTLGVIGGGAGGDLNAVGFDGASGGGGSIDGLGSPDGGIAIGSVGRDGGDAASYLEHSGGGGGGYSQNGFNAADGDGGYGGDGVISYMNGTSGIYYSGGGGGGSTGVGSSSGGKGGKGGGGKGSWNGGAIGVNGTRGLGGGGGGSTGGNQFGLGGNGTVIIKYALSELPPLASYTSNLTMGIPNLVVQFNDTSYPFIYSTEWNWTAKNITPGNNAEFKFSSTQNATGSFPAGNYTVKLNVTNANGDNISATNLWINVTPLNLVTVNYSCTADIIHYRNITCTASSSLTDDGIKSWSWDILEYDSSFGPGWGIAILSGKTFSLIFNRDYYPDGYPEYEIHNLSFTANAIPYGGSDDHVSNVNSTTRRYYIPDHSYITNVNDYNQTSVMYLFNDSLKTYGTIAAPGCITAMDIPELGSWIGMSTLEPMVYHQQIIDTAGGGFGSVYSGSANFGTGLDIATSDSAAFSTEGRGLFADIYLLDGTRKGTYTTGGIVRSVDVAVKNGLWAVSGGDDGKVYIYSKDATSAWYVFYQGDSDFPILSTAMSWKGEYVGAGRSNGILEYYSTSGTGSSSASNYMVNVFVSKGGSAYKGVSINITSGATAATATTAASSGLTDSYGKYSFSATDLKYYKININSGEMIFDYQATSSYTTITLNLPSPLLTVPYQYAASFNDTTNIITTTYDDVNIADINITVTDITNNTIIHMTDTHSTTITDTVLGDPTHEYRINIKFTRTTGVTYADTLYVRTSIFGKVTHTPDQWKLFEYAVYCLFLMFVALGVGTTSLKYGVVLIPALVVLGVGLGFLPVSIWLVPLGLSAFIAMLEALRRRSD
jgi:PKD repeat protein